MQEIKFDRLGAFTYSKEEGTAGEKMSSQIPEALKQKRYNEVMAAQLAIATTKSQEYIGKTLQDCFITGYDEDNLMYTARNYMYAPDDIDGTIYVAAKDEHKLGDLVTIVVKDADAYSLTGEEL